MSTRESQTGKFYFPPTSKSGLIIPMNPFTEQAEEIKLEKDAEEATKKLLELSKQKQEELEKKLEKLEIMPLGANIILLPYPENPYRKVMNGSIIVEYDGSFKNSDTGEWDKQQIGIGCAKVIEVGPNVKQVKTGDDIFVDFRVLVTIPFFGAGYRLASEPQVICVINENLKERFNM